MDQTPGQTMRRDQRLREEYKENRYLERLTAKELEDRINDIIVNMVRFDQHGKVVPHRIKDGGGYWFDIFTHALDEMRLRFGPYPAGFTSGFITRANVPNPSVPIAAKAAALWQKESFQPGEGLLKFGHRKYMEELVAFGKIRIVPASFYDDPSLNPAINDNELSLVTNPSNRPVALQGYKPPPFSRKGFEVLALEARATTNYYVTCLSTIYNPRLFVDFEYDSVVFIRKAVEFTNKLIESMEERLPGWQSAGGLVSYRAVQFSG